MLKYLVVIPCYNEAKRLNLAAFQQFLGSKKSQQIDLLFVNDGSRDNTIDLLKQLSEKYPNAEVLDLDSNQGKAEAIRSGINSTEVEKYEYLGYLDADLATPLEEIWRFTEILKSEERQILMLLGSRVSLLGMTDIKRNLSRHYLGRIFATLVSNLLSIPIYDTQCGAKMIHSSVSKQIFEEAFISKWLFDVELLFRLKKLNAENQNKLLEVPLKKWEEISGSKIKANYFLIAPFELFRIYLKYR